MVSKKRMKEIDKKVASWNYSIRESNDPEISTLLICYENGEEKMSKRDKKLLAGAIRYVAISIEELMEYFRQTASEIERGEILNDELGS